MEYNDFYINCVYIDAALWILCFIYRFICWAIKKIKREETEATVGNVLLWIIFACLTTIFGPVSLCFFTAFAGSWVITTSLSFLWNHGLETVCEWLCDHIFCKKI